MSEQQKFKILCPFCNAPYTAEMLFDLHGAEEASSPSGYGAAADISVEITCTNCKKAVYRKEETVYS